MKITKREIKQIKDGNHAVLMDCLDFLLDNYDDDKYSMGYEACVSDLSVHAFRLAEKLITEAKTNGKLSKFKKEKYYLLDQDEVEQIINDFFTDIINEK